MFKRLIVYGLIILLGLGLTSCDLFWEDRHYSQVDYRLFKNTAVWPLAKLLDAEEMDEIRDFIRKNTFDLETIERRYGQTLLMISVQKGQVKATQALLEAGANPNAHTAYNGSSPMLEAARLQNPEADNTVILKLLLAHKGNPNDETLVSIQDGTIEKETPLLIACGDVTQTLHPVEKAKVLVEAGAEINYVNPNSKTPLLRAIEFNHFDTALYLLEHGADYKRLVADRSQYMESGQKVYLVHILREKIVPMESIQYRQKMQVVDFLSQKGIHYRNEPVPPAIQEKIKLLYPAHYQDYLNRY
ncbi:MULTISPECIES: ankyrin repeat domain-containing protein [unclassified Siphonobacter]|uniref:ankyrin repeat domain-containing protein n=1 Tax=unclassified Siphonobacter TaxID=2635712 RepID=UPI000CC98B52|nr:MULTISPECIES: ankyrin repeat domain-containing protein [unclassified Siphonobacter]MDQ1089836.1 hypothetical protein [Siphonobacter sp. SORGH_AS_1065]PKK35021.1 hypothetical protein BWI96_19010 [Siphonobacter sp. SORGH_AS_0500]